MSQQPNVSLLARTEAAKGRKLKSATDVWAKAGRILVVERLWPITHKVLAVGLHIEALGNTWWSFKSQSLNEDQEKALLFWLNSSFALLLYFGRRVITRSAWMQMKKPAWASMPVLDVHALSAKQIADLAGRYDWLSGLNLRPLGQLKSDDMRAQIDSAITSTLGLPNVDFIRELLEREPELNANDISPRDVVPTLKIDEDEDQLTLV